MRNRVFSDIVKSAISIDDYYNLDDESIIDIVQFNQTWGSTALGFSCAGGDMMIEAITTIIFTSKGVDVFFGGRKAYRIKKPNKEFIDDLNKRCMKPVIASGKYES